MNALQPTEIIYREDKTINSDTTIKLFDEIIEKNYDKNKIYLILDNAPYYKNKKITEYIKNNPKLRIIYLPPYSPNLNLIERLWRLMRKEKMSIQYYENFASFKKSLLHFFENTNLFKDKIDSLISWNFHFPAP